MCLGHDGTAVVDTEGGCDRVCGKGGKDEDGSDSKKCTVEKCIGDECTLVVGSCPQPKHCPKDIFLPVAALSDGDSEDSGDAGEM